MLWSREVQLGCVVMWVGWVTGFALILAGWFLDHGNMGQLGIAVVILAATLMVVKDNQRTRRMLRRQAERPSGGAGERPNLFRIEDYM